MHKLILHHFNYCSEYFFFFNSCHRVFEYRWPILSIQLQVVGGKNYYIWISIDSSQVFFILIFLAHL